MTDGRPPDDEDAHADAIFAARRRRGMGVPSEVSLPGDVPPARPVERPTVLSALRAVIDAARAAPAPPAGPFRPVEARQALTGLGEAKLARLTASIHKLVPLAREGTKQAVMNQLNPAMAVTIAAGESAARLKALKGWGTLEARDRLIHVTGLFASLADIVGALTPPPANLAAQALGAGMSLVMLAAEGGQAPAPRQAPGKLEEWGDNLGHNLLDRWQSLTARLPRRRPPPD
ncbi:MAG: hypothetical protein JWM80_5221 [Cyanobacteria bacterium RYN_339]|nr:hypothetical protein [Cyanobacteria bacterium RYN_339]